MTYAEMRSAAKANLNGTCRVCPVCDGRVCAGEVPGMGGKGTGSSFMANVSALAAVKLNMRLVHDAVKPDMSITMFGKKMAMPVFAAPVSGTTLNMGGKFGEAEYISWIIKGTLEAGVYPMVGDTAIEQFLIDNLAELKKAGGDGIAIIKPWEAGSVIEKIRLAEDAGAFAVGMDIDAAGLVTLSLHGKGVSPKTVGELRSIRMTTNLPFILKGVMTPEDALAAIDAGADAIVVSNHGGRVLDGTPGAADVLPAIARACKGKIAILADGGVRSGVDVLKMIALGADVVLFGRPLVVASFGGKAEGVTLAFDRLRAELESAMILTGCASVADITDRVVFR